MRKNKFQYVILVRHGKHINNQLPPDVITEAIQIGKRLRKYLIAKKIDLPKIALSSPQWRSISTLNYILAGMGLQLPLFGVYKEFGDMRTGSYAFSNQELKLMYAETKKDHYDDPEQALAQLFPDKLAKRGEEGANILRNILLKNEGPFILVSHGGSRLEAIIQNLVNKPISMIPFYVVRSGVVILKLIIQKRKLRVDGIYNLGKLNKKTPNKFVRSSLQILSVRS